MIKEILKDIFPIIEQNAPMLAAALGTPLLSLPVAVLLSMLGKQFGIDKDEVSNEELIHSIKCDDQCHEKLKKLEEEFKKKYVAILPHEGSINQ